MTIRWAIVSICIAFPYCGRDAPTSARKPPSVASVDITADAETLLVNESQHLDVVLRDSTGGILSGRTLQWTIQDSSVVILEAAFNGGSVIGKRAGRTRVIASSEGHRDSANVVVGFIFSAIWAGGAHTCGLLIRGEVRCWGANGKGQLGDGDFNLETTPHGLVGTTRFSVVAMGGAHTCAVTSIGTLYCWGSNEFDQLGVGRNDASTFQPEQVSGSTAYRTVSAGTYHSCAIAVTDAVYCWGNNAGGELGIGVAGDPQNAPVPVLGDVKFQQVRAAPGFTCGLGIDGSVYCWGVNAVGQLGDGTTTHRLSPTPIASSLKFKQLDAATNYACAVSVTDELYCWGDIPDFLDQRDSIPFPAAPDFRFLSVSLSNDFLCGISTSGVGLCWGKNQYGDLGTGNTNNSFSPIPIALNASLKALVTGGYHACALDSSNVGYCWGYNSTGQLGQGFLSEADSVPKRVISQP